MAREPGFPLTPWTSGLGEASLRIQVGPGFCAELTQELSGQKA